MSEQLSQARQVKALFDAAAEFSTAGYKRKAVEKLIEAAALDPNNPKLRNQLAVYFADNNMQGEGDLFFASIHNPGKPVVLTEEAHIQLVREEIAYFETFGIAEKAAAAKRTLAKLAPETATPAQTHS